jgi:3-oxoacid CoA-transferase subunit B
MPWTTEQMCLRAAKELKDGYYVNLGIGMPTQVANYVPKGMDIILQSENGLLGIGPFPADAEVDPDASFFDSATSFGMIRGGHIDVAILGALQVAENGDLANWMVPGKMVKGMGGAMDLVAGVKKIVVLMEHNAKDGGAKLLKQCTFPLTGTQVVDLVITEIAVFSIDASGMTLIEKAPDISVEEITKRTEAAFKTNLSAAAA